MRRTHVQRLRCVAALALVLALGACAGTDAAASNGAPDDADQAAEGSAEAPPAEESGPDEGSGPDEAESADADGSVPSQPDPGPSADQTTEVRVDGRELIWGSGTDEQLIARLHPEGESTFVAAAVRPGSTAGDATVVALTMAEGFYDLRYLTYRDGTASELVVFPEPYRPDQRMLADDGVAPVPVWSPDGGSLAWLEWGRDDEVQLRTVGWDDDGPGTGRTADDNATFAVELPSEVWLDGWRDHGDVTRLDVASHDGRAWTITLARQGDGAWAMEADAVAAG